MNTLILGYLTETIHSWLSRGVHIVNSMTSRDWSAFIWISILVIGALFIEKARRSMWRLVKCFFSPYILSVCVVMFIYIYLEILLISKIGLWSQANDKDTFFWVFGTAFALMMTASRANEKDDYFSNMLKDCSRFTIVLACC